MFTVLIFFFMQNTADEMRLSDCKSDVCSSDLLFQGRGRLCKAADEKGTGKRELASAERNNAAHHVVLLFFVIRCQAERYVRRQFVKIVGTGSLPEGEIGRAECRERVCQYV